MNIRHLVYAATVLSSVVVFETIWDLVAVTAISGGCGTGVESCFARLRMVTLVLVVLVPLAVVVREWSYRLASRMERRIAFGIVACGVAAFAARGFVEIGWALGGR
jgi:hypothetical protein